MKDFSYWKDASLIFILCFRILLCRRHYYCRKCRQINKGVYLSISWENRNIWNSNTERRLLLLFCKMRWKQLLYSVIKSIYFQHLNTLPSPIFSAFNMFHWSPLSILISHNRIVVSDLIRSVVAFYQWIILWCINYKNFHPHYER